MKTMFKLTGVQSAERADNFIRVRIEDVIVDTNDNTRFAPGDVEKLKYSIKNEGQLQPVGLNRFKDAEGKYRVKLVYGYTRFEAIRQLNLDLPADEHILLKGEVFEGNSTDQLMRCIDENFVRSEYSHMDAAKSCRAMKDRLNWSDKRISNRVHRSTAWVNQHLKLFNLIDELQLKLHMGEITFTAAMELVDLPEDQQKAFLESALNSTDPDKKIGAKSVKAAKQAGGAVNTTASGKRTWSEILFFFEANIGSPAASEKLQQISQLMVNLAKGFYEDNELFFDFERVLAGEQPELPATPPDKNATAAATEPTLVAGS